MKHNPGFGHLAFQSATGNKPRLHDFWKQLCYIGALFRGKGGPPVLAEPAQHRPGLVWGFIRPPVCPTIPIFCSAYGGAARGLRKQVFFQGASSGRSEGGSRLNRLWTSSAPGAGKDLFRRRMHPAPIRKQFNCIRYPHVTVNGGMSEWTSWTNKDCKQSYKYRYKTCTAPKPLFGGNPCSPDMFMKEAKICPGLTKNIVL